MQPVRVTFADPRASAAVLPVSIACAPATGDAFPVGTTTVSCTITDARQQSFKCSFTVKVTGPPRLSATTYLAFGDSLTSGSSPPDPIDSYPPRLKAQLAPRYPFQTIVVINDGRAGENAQATGRTRLPVALDLYKPGALILMEGEQRSAWRRRRRDRGSGRADRDGAGRAQPGRDRFSRHASAAAPQWSSERCGQDDSGLQREHQGAGAA
jgi:hypothetical protein